MKDDESGFFGSGSIVSAAIAIPKSYNFTPQADITALEAAHLAFFFAGIRNFNGVEVEEHISWPIVKRHFTEIEE